MPSIKIGSILWYLRQAFFQFKATKFCLPFPDTNHQIMKHILPLLLIATLISCKESSVDTKAEGEKLMQVSRDWAKASEQRDAEKVISYWADDAVVISASHPMVKGRQSISEMVKEGYAMPGFNITWEPESVEVSKGGDMAYLIENSKMSFPDSTGNIVTMHNKTVTIWKKQDDGSWKNVVDISTPINK
jgi:uncharacterized protein (TIGR02246 family)